MRDDPILCKLSRSLLRPQGQKYHRKWWVQLSRQWIFGKHAWENQILSLTFDVRPVLAIRRLEENDHDREARKSGVAITLQLEMWDGDRRGAFWLSKKIRYLQPMPNPHRIIWDQHIWETRQHPEAYLKLGETQRKAEDDQIQMLCGVASQDPQVLAIEQMWVRPKSEVSVESYRS